MGILEAESDRLAVWVIGVEVQELVCEEIEGVYWGEADFAISK